ncbi:LacI family DNA-binding transcriptional regulator [Actinoplanes sp. GCM10030250]|uniref:LacI family DNA-binding transcriptional regulator n=1 Tax=Actinoplanes sp. GCM10030250 TaxID=3273376 RepID=UPI00361B0F1D
MPTLQDVAREAGVSKMTVSNVLNGRRDRVSPATIARVMEVVGRLGYVPNATARSLSARRSNIVALAFPGRDSSRGEPLMDPHDSVFLAEVESHVTRAGLYLMAHSVNSVESTADSLRSWNVDGAIFLGTRADEVAALHRAYEAPMVFIDNHGTSPHISNVGIEDRLGGHLAARRLIEAGHRRIGFVGPRFDEPGVVRERHAGFVQALAEAGLSLRPEHVVRCNTSFDAAVAVAQQVLAAPQRPTAIFATADIIAAGLLKGFVRAGCPVPDEMSIIGFDDLEVARHVTPEITTLRQDIPAKARAAVEVLLAQLAQWPSARSERRVLGVTLIERGSVGPPPASMPGAPLRVYR